VVIGATVRNTQYPSIPEDQFLPTIALDPTSDAGLSVIDWYDTIESTLAEGPTCDGDTCNLPSSIHGQVQALSGSIPSDVLFYPGYTLGPGAGPANGGNFDLGVYGGAGPFTDGTHFGMGFTDGIDTVLNDAGIQTGIFTMTVSP
jgi:hypothetical protein